MKKLIALLVATLLLVATSSPSSSRKVPSYLGSIRPLVWQDPESDDKNPIPHCTAFCINSPLHTWVTAAHCFSKESQPEVTIDKRIIHILQLDYVKDLAILYAQVPSTDLQLSPYSPTWGEDIHAVGYVSGETFPMIFFGKIANPSATPIQFGKVVAIMDMSIGGGASGGPVLNSNDQVVGVSEISFGAGPFNQISPMSGAITYDILRDFTEGYWR